MNYIIIGTSRSGKTMLTNKLCREIPGFCKISIDNLKGTFEKIIPELKIDFYNGIGNKEILPNFLDCFFKGAIDKDEKDGLSYVMEGDGLEFEKILEFSKQDNIKVIVLGKSSLTTQDYFNEIRYYEGKYLYSEWTKKLNNQELFKRCNEWITRSKEYKKLCKQYEIDFYDTSFNQNDVINNIVDIVKNYRR